MWNKFLLTVTICILYIYRSSWVGAISRVLVLHICNCTESCINNKINNNNLHNCLLLCWLSSKHWYDLHGIIHKIHMDTLSVSYNIDWRGYLDTTYLGLHLFVTNSLTLHKSSIIFRTFHILEKNAPQARRSGLGDMKIFRIILLCNVNIQSSVEVTYCVLYIWIRIIYYYLHTYYWS